MTAEPLLDVRDLKVSFRTEDGLVKAVDGVSLTLSEGETLGIVGESGSGKSVTMMSVMRLINDPNARFEGEVLYKGHDLMTLSPDQMRAIRGTGISMIFQDPMTSLNPVYRSAGRSPSRSGRTTRSPSRRRGPGRSSCWPPWASRRPPNGSTVTRTSSPVACGSG